VDEKHINKGENMTEEKLFQLLSMTMAIYCESCKSFQTEEEILAADPAAYPDNFPAACCKCGSQNIVEIEDTSSPDGEFLLVQTRFHGGGIISRHTTRESADAAAYRYRSVRSCVCGCCGVLTMDEYADLSEECSNPYRIG
jgi:hypothetical protein